MIFFGDLKKKIKNCDACFHCMGITSFGQNSNYYYKVTYEMTKALADLVYRYKPKFYYDLCIGRRNQHERE